jgi:hypothetical protein
MMHVRNSLWIPLDLFPMPQALLSAGKLGLSLFRDALEQRRVLDFFRGVWRLIKDGPWFDRHAMSRERWLHLRSLVRADKTVAQAEA